jgi:hypothetical protein
MFSGRLDDRRVLLALIAIFLGFLAFGELNRWLDGSKSARRDKALDEICDTLADLDRDNDLHERIWRAVDACDRRPNN